MVVESDFYLQNGNADMEESLSYDKIHTLTAKRTNALPALMYHWFETIKGVCLELQ